MMMMLLMMVMMVMTREPQKAFYRARIKRLRHAGAHRPVLFQHKLHETPPPVLHESSSPRSSALASTTCLRISMPTSWPACHRGRRPSSKPASAGDSPAAASCPSPAPSRSPSRRPACIDRTAIARHLAIPSCRIAPLFDGGACAPWTLETSSLQPRWVTPPISVGRPTSLAPMRHYRASGWGTGKR